MEPQMNTDTHRSFNSTHSLVVNFIRVHLWLILLFNS